MPLATMRIRTALSETEIYGVPSGGIQIPSARVSHMPGSKSLGDTFLF
jgi:hypothetical protein